MRKLLPILSWLVLAVAAAAAPAQAQSTAARPIRLVVPYTAGGPVDVLARLLADRLPAKLGQPVIVENKPGAGALIGTRAVLDAPADGLTLLMSTTTVATNTLVMKDAGYAIDDLAHIAPVGGLPIVFVTNPRLPVKSVGEFVAYLKDRPGKANYSTLGAGSFTELLTDRFLVAAGVDMVPVPYKGGADATMAVVAGDTQLYAPGVAVAQSLIKSGQLKPLAVASEERSVLLPDVPTFRESGFPEMLGTTWIAIAVRASTPAPVVARLRDALMDVVRAPEYRQKIVGIGIEAWIPRAEDLPALIRQDLALWEKDIRRLKARPQ